MKACAICGRQATHGTRCTTHNTRPRYDHTHRTKRNALIPRAVGQTCPFCTKTMTADQQLELDHTHGRIAHASCNRSAGAAITNAT
jgi:hypothetical protein